MSEDWPSPAHPDERGSLPRIEDLPRGEGFEADAVTDAFDAFYRHLAQLDSTLRTLEAVDTFSRHAAELRADLRSIRVAGWSPYPRGYPVAAPQSLGAGLPEALPRIALEVVFLVVVAVVVAVSNLPTWQIVTAMAAAFVLAALAELIAGRERAPVARPVVPAEPPPARDEPVPAAPPAAVVRTRPAAMEEDAAEAVGWAAFAEPSGPEALTVMGAVTFDEREAEAIAEPELEPAPEVELAVEAEEDPEPSALAEPVVEAEPEGEHEREPEHEPEPSETTAEFDSAALAEEADLAAEAEEPEPEPVAEAEREALPEPAAEPERVAEVEPEPEPEPAPTSAVEEEPVLAEDRTDAGRRRRWAWRRRPREPVPEAEPVAREEPETPKHVRVLPPPEPVLERDLDPWERGFDFDLEQEDLSEEPADAEDELPLRRPPR